ncbi:hypothetical protein WN943_015165 [Citrus x changshan-huyou]
MEAYSPYVAMILVQFAYGGSNILVKISLEKGLNHLVFVVYRHVLAMVLKHRPKLSFAVMAKIFVLALFGATIHLNVYYTGFSYVSLTVATALSNVIPSFTFLLAFLLGMEKVKITSGRGGAKVLGTIVCIGGSLIFTFWKRGCLLKGFVQKPLIHIYDTDQLRHHGNENWFKGSALILTSHISWSAWLILLATVSKDYPAPLSLNALICFFASLQSSFVALFIGRNPTLWKLDWNVQLLTIVYCVSILLYIL